MERKSVLYIDDEKVINKIARKIIGNAGHEVCTFSSSVDALEVFQLDPQHFDMVFTDYMMPNMCGDQLATKIKAIRNDIPIVLISGIDLSKKANHPESVIDGFLKKPFTVKELINLVENPPQPVNNHKKRGKNEEERRVA